MAGCTYGLCREEINETNLDDRVFGLSIFASHVFTVSSNVSLDL